MTNEEMNVIIGLEVHCQLNTSSKLFCACSADFRGDAPNTHTCPVCLGLPGTLPVLNKRAIEYALKVAKAFNCVVLEKSEFCRKNYFYPDLVKAYQITMGDNPLAVGGYVEIEDDAGNPKIINLTRIHVEEDPGRLVHMGNREYGHYTLVDYNRSGIPLIEMVTEPELSSPKEARRFLNKLRAMLEYLDVFDPEKEGAIRVDANISIKGHERVEIKNISSYKGVEKALIFEITRQKNLINRGGTIVRETRHFQEGKGTTISARSKETATDYRYFPEPDLPIICVADWIKDIISPELPDARRDRFMQQYGITANHAKTLTGDLKLAEFYETIADVGAAITASWTADILIGELNYRDMSLGIVAPHASEFKDLVTLIRDKKITDKAGIEVLRVWLDNLRTGTKMEKPTKIVERLNLARESGEHLRGIVEQILASNPQAIIDHKTRKKGALNFIVGQVVKETRGKFDPREIHAMIAEFVGK
ncbi:MAG: Asp-tRNA(Asn)/Glu-tRNA(Gln) amidotransferase subunit GatB [Methanocalculaceae archaeon]|jgi:aspartyl-tRNA(Asn)/glutamyl-tRNA(Gln) amidotransferase subunit B|nr:Asp-tRNA(Asn)/Glu-tRNA(Gln) amidotransferase subunit GatB [Methanocalculaceae archaeon]